jgi:hypothetical protein
LPGIDRTARATGPREDGEVRIQVSAMCFAMRVLLFSIFVAAFRHFVRLPAGVGAHRALRMPDT